ncbi:MAG: hypothetical protein KGJ59_01435 [Bacteroidota bacterium]|nr:hypothetical protein [Bacteroidota bacterium]
MLLHRSGSKTSSGKFGTAFFSLFRSQPRPLAGVYNIQVVSLQEELDAPVSLPKELRYALFNAPSLKERLESVLQNGKAIGVRTVQKTPERVLSAINTVSQFSQHKTIVTWLPALLIQQKLPNILRSDYERAREQHVDLNREIATILDHRLEFKKFMIIDDNHVGLTSEDTSLIADLNALITPIVLKHVVSRMTFDNADTRTEIAQSILKALLIIGPITQVLELYTRGFGKIFAASMDDILSEVAELFALRGSGFAWKQLVQRMKILVPVFALASYGAYHVDTLIAENHLALAGILFGASAVALSLTTALQSIRMYKQCIDALIAEEKLPPASSVRRWLLALRQDFTNPARLGLFTGAFVSPIAAMIVFIGLPFLVHNGWALAILGTAETLTAGSFVVIARQLNALRFQIALSRLLSRQFEFHGSRNL